jgi:hypothetical protein
MADIDKVGNQWKSNDGRLHDNYADAQHSNFQDSQVQDAVNIMTGGGEKSLASSLRDAADRAASEADQARLREEQRKEEAQVVNSLVEFYCAENWDAIINTTFYGVFYQIAWVLVVIASCKKGNYKRATQCLDSFLPNFTWKEWKEDLSANALKVLSEWDCDKWDWKKNNGVAPDDYLKEMVKQAYSKTQGRKVSDTEFNQSQLPIHEENIRELYTNMIDLYGQKLSNAKAIQTADVVHIQIALKKWAELQGKETLTEEDMQKIAGSNAKLLNFLLYLKKAEKPSKVAKIVKLVIFGTIAFFVVRFIINVIKAV